LITIPRLIWPTLKNEEGNSKKPPSREEGPNKNYEY
jgi:hypothetical protein